MNYGVSIWTKAICCIWEASFHLVVELCFSTFARQWFTFTKCRMRWCSASHGIDTDQYSNDSNYYYMPLRSSTLIWEHSWFWGSSTKHFLVSSFDQTITTIIKLLFGELCTKWAFRCLWIIYTSQFRAYAKLLPHWQIDSYRWLYYMCNKFRCIFLKLKTTHFSIINVFTTV